MIPDSWKSSNQPTDPTPSQDIHKLFTGSYICILAANFLLYFGFWLLIPVLPFYLKESFQCPESTIGFVLCAYTVSALCTRPFMGYLYDGFPRKPIYLLAYLIFMLIFAGYVGTENMILFIVLRILHGVAFGTVTVGGNTLVIDITPSQRRGTALGFYGLTNNIAMSIGPMAGLLLHDHQVSFEAIFCCGLGSCIAGLLAASAVKAPVKQTIKRPPISLDRFFLIKGIPASIALFLLSIPYGATTNYVAMYANQIGLNAPTGFFFTFMAIGMGISRLFAGKYVDRGYVTETISYGFYLVTAAFLLLSACGWIQEINSSVCLIVFYTIPFMLGIGFGTMFPAYNTLYVNLAPNNQRGTATSTYLTSWDLGVGLGILSGGIIAEWSSFSQVYLFGTVLCLISMVYFNRVVTPHFQKNKLR